ncbi:MAG TPA: L,D-transpeptidase [Solirubrobacteraceae bacterium]
MTGSILPPTGDGAPRRRGRKRIALAVLAGLIPIVPIIIALSLSGGGGSGQTATAGSLYTPVAQAPSRPSETLPPGAGSLVALVKHPTEMRSRPAGHAIAHLGRRTDFGSPAALWVVRRSAGWLGVVSPLAGNGKVGWIPASDTWLSRVDWQLRVSLASRHLSVLEGGRIVARYKVAIGAPASPTPTGRFAVTDRLNTGDPSGPYGCCILALSAKAPHAIQGWNGGDRIAIHSTPETWSIGHAISHGCVRLTLAEGRWLLAHIPLGTPTLISG